jgi:DNA repair exonuclease SbcCD ATPase subunit
MSFRTLLFMATLALGATVAHAQVTYRCVAADGKKYYGSTIPQQCYGRPVEQISKSGSVIKRIDPEGDAKARAEKEAAAAKNKEEDVAAKEETRRNRALLATYTSEKDIEEARRRALQDNEKQVKEVETKIDSLKKTRAKYDKELEFYQDKKSGKAAPPPKLSTDIRNAEIDLKAQEDLLAAKKKEVSVINAKYDEDKKRFVELAKKGGVR